MAIARIAPYELPSPGSWPECRAPWELDPSRAALLVHDMQDYFLRPFQPEASPLVTLLTNVAALRSACALSKIPVIFSTQPGEQSRSERGLLWDLWGPGIIASPGQEGVAFEVRPASNDVMLPKRRYSAFHETGLHEMLLAQGRDQLIICGVYAHIGCLATATDGFMLGVKPFVVADATADFSSEDHAVALRQVARTCGVVTTVESVLSSVHEARVRSALSVFELDGLNELGPEDDLGDYGLDSIRLMRLVEELLPQAHELDFAELVQARSLRALTELLARTSFTAP